MDMSIRLNARVGPLDTQIRALLQHPMENGYRTNESGVNESGVIAAHFITEITLSINGSPISVWHTGGGMSTDPLLAWRVRDVQIGDTVTLNWRDNRGLSASKSCVAERIT